jgi:HD-like signal output (HDOD) protein
MRFLCGRMREFEFMNDVPLNVKIQGIMEKLESLPTLPTIVTKILQLVNNPKSATGDISKIIQIDQTLTMKVLRIVNSAFYGFPKKIDTVSQATVILGYDAIKNNV